MVHVLWIVSIEHLHLPLLSVLLPSKAMRRQRLISGKPRKRRQRVVTNILLRAKDIMNTMQ